MRVALLVTDLERGGAPLRVARMARGLRSLGVDVCVGCLAARGPVTDALERDTIRTFACDARNARDWRTLLRLRAHVRSISPDIIHATLTHANVAARLVGAALRIPVVTSTATIEVERPWHLWAERATARLDRGHIVNSRTLAVHAVRAFRRPASGVFVIPPSLSISPGRPDRTEARRALDIADHEFVVLWAGRFDPVKRLDLVLRCAEIMNTVPCRFLLAGDGPYRPEVERQVRISSVARRVTLLGWIDDLAPIIAASDAMLFPSLTEGMPNAVLEAMAGGLPIVGSDIPALHELSQGGRCIRIVRGADAKSFADALLALGRDDDARTELSRNARDFAATLLDPLNSAQALLAVYDYILGRG